MTQSEIKSFFTKVRDLKILVIGDVMVDAYIWGDVDRISPEAPVPVIRVDYREDRLGGAANVALNLKAMGASPLLCSYIGDDAQKDNFIGLLSEENMSDVGILVDSNRITTVKTRIISEHQHLLRVDEETSERINPEKERQLIGLISDLLSQGQINAIVYQDYDKGIITPQLIRQVNGIANRQNIPVMADPKKRNFSHFKNIRLFKPNFKEFTEGLKTDLHKRDFKRMSELSHNFLEKQQIDQMMITLSEAGIFICDKEDYEIIPAEIRDVADVSGAGDTVISLAALAQASGLSMKDTANICNLGGGLVCEKVGVVPVNRDELYEECVRVLGI